MIPRRILPFFTSVSKRAFTDLPKRSGLKIYVWQPFIMNGEQIEVLTQKKAVKESIFDKDVSKMPHIACEFKITLSDIQASQALIGKIQSALVKSEEYLREKNGEELSIEDRREVLNKYANTKIKAVDVYLSWYPADRKDGELYFAGVSVDKILDIEKKILPAELHWAAFLLTKMYSVIRPKSSDITSEMINIDTTTLYDVDFQKILSDLSNFIVFSLDDGVVTAQSTMEHSSFYMRDLLKDHINCSEIQVPDLSDHLCSTFVARVLRNALGDAKYNEVMIKAQKKVGYSCALPELVFEAAKQAKLIEEETIRASSFVNPSKSN